MNRQTNCPICNSDQLQSVLKLNDWFLSMEEFELLECEHCNFLITNPHPETEKLSEYYKSDEYISHTNDKKGLFSSLYQSARKIALKNKYNTITKFKQEGSILDIGCGTGEFLNYFKQKGWKVSGIEPDTDARNRAIENYNLNVFGESKIREFEQYSFDVISMWHVLEHVPDLNKRMNELFTLLQNNGFAIIALPNFKSFDASCYKEYWAAYDVPRHLFHFSQKSVRLLGEKHGFKLVDTLPMKFDSYYVSLLSEKYKNGSKNLVRAFVNGKKSNQYAKKNNKNYSSLIYVFKKAEN